MATSSWTRGCGGCSSSIRPATANSSLGTISRPDRMHRIRPVTATGATRTGAGGPTRESRPRGGIEPPTFRFSVEDCRNIAAVATAYVSQGVWPYETYQRFATVIGVSQVLTTNKRQLSRTGGGKRMEARFRVLLLAGFVTAYWWLILLVLAAISAGVALWLGHQRQLEAAGRRSPEHGAKPSSATVYLLNGTPRSGRTAGSGRRA